MQFSAWLGLTVASLAVSPGCSCGSEGARVPVSDVGVGGSGGAGGGGAGGSPVVAAQGGGGEGGVFEVADRGRTASDVVSAGQVVRSPGYRMVFTLGQPTQNQGKTTSPSYRMQGGLVGANGSLP
ncbi:hypothetical protein BE15_28655 [Sorangium cellulosum]|uniref:Uncharacterized protein n=1 Tax=Sorangium cellulosum TaxID=56 RepID=A0A150QA81_SORCE|nr:hypothetical protein BE15_28655 [Sorangium cellulosum]